MSEVTPKMINSNASGLCSSRHDEVIPLLILRRVVTLNNDSENGKCDCETYIVGSSVISCLGSLQPPFLCFVGLNLQPDLGCSFLGSLAIKYPIMIRTILQCDLKDHSPTPFPLAPRSVPKPVAARFPHSRSIPPPQKVPLPQ